MTWKEYDQADKSKIKSLTLSLGSRKYCGTMVPERLKIMKKELYVIGNSILTFDLDFINFIKIPRKRGFLSDNVLVGAEYELTVNLIQAALNFYKGKIEIIKDGMDS